MYTKMELELKEARELEKSNRYQLQSSRDMIGSLQETVSQLVYLKRDVKKLKYDINSKDITITNINKDKENIQQKHNENIQEIRRLHERQIEDLVSVNLKKVQQVQYDLETKIAEFTCVIEELRSKVKEMEAENTNKMNVVVLEYEEKIQRSASEISQLQEKLAMQTSRNDANIDAYRRKIEDLESKLKQCQFKEYLAQNSYSSQIENRVERPYSVGRDYSECSELNSAPLSPRMSVHSRQKPTLQVVYDNRTIPKNEKKSHFNITKKRKLYSDKDFLNQ
nr:uncharacterized protein LOC116767574 [Danaus plexippus plexippus]